MMTRCSILHHGLRDTDMVWPRRGAREAREMQDHDGAAVRRPERTIQRFGQQALGAMGGGGMERENGHESLALLSGAKRMASDRPAAPRVEMNG
jgi:hypothetical protein